LRLAKHLEWPEAKAQAAINYAEAFPEETEQALSENAAVDFDVLRRMLPDAIKSSATRIRKSRDAQASPRWAHLAAARRES
jgi:hypothetical protein